MLLEEQKEKTFDELLKEKVNKSKKNNRKHSNQRFYMLFLAYKIMKKILLNPDIPERELKLVNSNFSRILLSILEQKGLIKQKYNSSNKNYVYELNLEGMIYLDFMDEFLTTLGYKPYTDKEINTNNNKENDGYFNF